MSNTPTTEHLATARVLTASLRTDAHRWLAEALAAPPAEHPDGLTERLPELALRLDRVARYLGAWRTEGPAPTPADPDPQIDFAVAVAEDPDMTPENKLHWLLICATERQGHIDQTRDYLQGVRESALHAHARAVETTRGIDQAGRRRSTTYARAAEQTRVLADAVRSYTSALVALGAEPARDGPAMTAMFAETRRQLGIDP